MGEKGEKTGYEVCLRTSQYLPKARFLQQIGIWTIDLYIEEENNKTMAINAKILELNWKVQFYSPFSVSVKFCFSQNLGFGSFSVLVTFQFC